MARTIELSEGTGRLLDLKRQLEEVVNNITSYFDEVSCDAETINERIVNSLYETNKELDKAFLFSVNEEFAGSKFKRI